MAIAYEVEPYAKKRRSQYHLRSMIILNAWDMPNNRMNRTSKRRAEKWVA